MKIVSIKNSEFFRNVMKMFSSTIFAQFIQIIGSFLLARLYDPAQFGFFSLFMSILMFLVLLSTLRYESIIIIEKIEKIALMMMNSLFIYGFSLSLFILLILLLIPEPILIQYKINSFYYLIPLGVVIYSFYNILTSYYIRIKDFTFIAKSKIFIAFFVVLFQLIFYYLDVEYGLIIGFVLGYLFIVIYMFSVLVLNKKVYISSKKRILVILKKYFYLVKFGLPAQLVDTMSNAVLPILIAMWFDLRLAGLYYFAYKIINIPLQLIGVAVGKVYYQKASYLFNHKREQLYTFTIKIIALISITVFIPMIILFFFSEDIIVLFIGDKWIESGTYVSMLVYMLFFRTIFSSISTLADITQKLKVIFVFSIMIFCVYVTSMYIGYQYNDFILAIKIISISNALLYLSQILYLVFVTKKLKVLI